MPQVKVYGKLWRGENHVHTNTRDEGSCVLFVPRIELDGHRVDTADPGLEDWKKAGYPESMRPEDPFPQPEISFGEGFVMLAIKHATDETWAYLSTLPEDAYGEGSTRERFEVMVTGFEYIQLEPGDDDPWEAPNPLNPLVDALKHLERSSA